MKKERREFVMINGFKVEVIVPESTDGEKVTK